VAEKYGRTAQTLHWLMFLLIAGAFGVGLWMAGLPVGPQRFRAVPWHKAIGITIFALVFIRLLWRLTHPAPSLPAAMPAWERHAAHASHWGLYLLMFAVPLSGWLMSSALGFSTVVFGIRVPDLLERNRELGDILKTVHYFLNKTLLLLIVLHFAAALKHYFIDRDDILQRMLPWRTQVLEKP
jgi:cytochrome b561